MTKYEENAFKLLIDELRCSTAEPYSSNHEYEDGIDVGRENSADELEYLIDSLLKLQYR